MRDNERQIEEEKIEKIEVIVFSHYLPFGARAIWDCNRGIVLHWSVRGGHRGCWQSAAAAGGGGTTTHNTG